MNGFIALNGRVELKAYVNMSPKDAQAEAISSLKNRASLEKDKRGKCISFYVFVLETLPLLDRMTLRLNPYPKIPLDDESSAY